MNHRCSRVRMGRFRKVILACTGLGCWLVGVGIGLSSPVQAGTLLEALTQGNPTLDLRYRFEWVDEEGKAKHARASTVRTRLGYRSGAVWGFRGFLEWEDVTVVGPVRYNDTTGRRKNVDAYPEVVDPEGTELNQAYLETAREGRWHVRYGRQRLTFGNHRFIGNVGFRQNEQTLDALRVDLHPWRSFTLTYAYVTNANRIFGEDHPTKSDLPMHTHLVYGIWKGSASGAAHVYGFFLDPTRNPSGAHTTLGARLEGPFPWLDRFQIQYGLEGARQRPYADGATTNRASYTRVDLSWVLGGFGIRLTREVLGGNGTWGFQTPLATLHAYQGWTDRFLTTPADGVDDRYLTLTRTLAGIQWTAVYHHFRADRGGDPYGTEWALRGFRSFGAAFQVGAKVAVYRSEEHPAACGDPSPAHCRDVTKVWFWFRVAR